MTDHQRFLDMFAPTGLAESYSKNSKDNENKISKTTINYGKTRGIYVRVNDWTSHKELTLQDEDGDGDHALNYRANADMSYTFMDNDWLPDMIKEELPATIRDEKHLRDVIKFIAVELKRK